MHQDDNLALADALDAAEQAEASNRPYRFNGDWTDLGSAVAEVLALRSTPETPEVAALRALP